MTKSTASNEALQICHLLDEEKNRILQMKFVLISTSSSCTRTKQDFLEIDRTSFGSISQIYVDQKILMEIANKYIRELLRMQVITFSLFNFGSTGIFV